MPAHLVRGLDGDTDGEHGPDGGGDTGAALIPELTISSGRHSALCVHGMAAPDTDRRLALLGAAGCTRGRPSSGRSNSATGPDSSPPSLSWPKRGGVEPPRHPLTGCLQRLTCARPICNLPCGGALTAHDTFDFHKRLSHTPRPCCMHESAHAPCSGIEALALARRCRSLRRYALSLRGEGYAE